MNESIKGGFWPKSKELVKEEKNINIGENKMKIKLSELKSMIREIVINEMNKK